MTNFSNVIMSFVYYSTMLLCIIVATLFCYIISKHSNRVVTMPLKYCNEMVKIVCKLPLDTTDLY